MAARVLFTYEDLLQTPDDGKRYEIVDGEMLVSPSPFPRHQRAQMRLIQFLTKADEGGYGQLWAAPLDIVFDEHNVTEPDLLFIRRDRLFIVGDKNVQGPPDLLVEILSESTAHRDLGVKLRAYEKFGVPYYWVVDPVAQIVRLFELQGDGKYGKARLIEGDDLLSCSLFPEFTMPVAGIFA